MTWKSWVRGTIEIFSSLNCNSLSIVHGNHLPTNIYKNGQIGMEGERPIISL